MSTVGLSGNPTNAVSSNDELFTAERVEGDWIVESKKAFNSEENFAVTIDAIVYNIKVTDEEKSGQCGENLTWTLDDSGNVTISGTGGMYENYGPTEWPWYPDRQSIKRIVIEEGVTNTGRGAFYAESNLTNIVLPSTLTDLGITTSSFCSSLGQIELPSNLNAIGTRHCLRLKCLKV